ncbi:MAG TPA: hypothetical protein VFD58_28240 [Blastocatellia bacterium]|nr:hypothetical protein [Blastocatellia bacterium]
MKVTGETAIKLAMRYGLPIHKEPDEAEGYRADIPLEDAQWIVSHSNHKLIYVEAAPELVMAVEGHQEEGA